MDDPVLFSPRQLVPATKLVRSLAACFDQVQKEPLFITKNHDIRAVMVSLEEYRRLMRCRKMAEEQKKLTEELKEK